MGRLSAKTVRTFDKAKKSFQGVARIFGAGDLKRGLREASLDLSHLVSAIEWSFGEVKAELNKLESKLDRIEGKLDKLEGKLDRLEDKADQQTDGTNIAEAKIDRLIGTLVPPPVEVPEIPDVGTVEPGTVVRGTITFAKGFTIPIQLVPTVAKVKKRR